MNFKICISFFGVLSLAVEGSLAFLNNGGNGYSSIVVSEKQQLSASRLFSSYMDDELFLMQSAQNCATSDTCSAEEMKRSYDNVMRIESKCASGVIVGSPVCENADTSAELIALLRQKIEQGSQKLSTLETGSNLTGISLAVIFLSAFVFAVAGTEVSMNPDDVVPFTPQEWWWSTRDGYLPTMLHHYFREGGLVTVDSLIQ